MDQTLSTIQRIESFLITIGVTLFQTIFFFLDAPNQSLMVSFLHYAIFFVGLYCFVYHAGARGIYRPLFFVFVLMSLISYIVFNKCLLTHMELGISKERNAIQGTVETFFGSQIEGNTSSKVVLSILTMVTGLFLAHDYNILKVSD